MMEIKNILKNNFRLHDIELLNNEVDLVEDLYSRHGKFEEVKEEIDASSEDIEFNARRGFASGHFSPPSYHYEQHAYHPPAPPPPAPYKAVYEVIIKDHFIIWFDLIWFELTFIILLIFSMICQDFRLYITYTRLS